VEESDHRRGKKEGGWFRGKCRPSKRGDRQQTFPIKQKMVLLRKNPAALGTIDLLTEGAVLVPEYGSDEEKEVGWGTGKGGG